MSDVMGQQKTRVESTDEFETNTILSDTEVAEYLVTHSDFFAKHAHLLEDLAVPHAQKGSVSLVELQSEQLRTKVRLLNHKLNQLIAIARQNEQLYRVYADLNLRLLASENLQELQYVLADVMEKRLHLESAMIKPFVGDNAFPEIQRRIFVEKRFQREKFFFGRLSEHEKKLLFPEQEANSVALLLLGESGELGMLAFSSKDASHFNPEMDTLLISQLQQFLSILLPKLLR